VTGTFSSFRKGLIGFPDPPQSLPVEPHPDRHRLPDGVEVVSAPVLGGLHRTYQLVKAA